MIFFWVIATKFNLNSAFVHIFIGSYWLRIEIYIVFMSKNTTLTQYLVQTYKHVHRKMQQSCSENKLTLGDSNL